jgi:flavin prenyltransferase
MYSLPPKKITLGMSGASGALYWLKLLECLIRADIEVLMLFSTAGQIVLNSELSLDIPNQPQKMAQFWEKHFKAQPGQITAYGKDQWTAPVASGGAAPKAMVVCPCTTGCVSAIARGASDNLLERAADVVIKEQGKLVLVVREMPFSTIHLQNMLELSRMGVCVMPANPGFYFKPTTLEEVRDFVVAKILDQFQIVHDLVPRWDKHYL